MTAKRYYSSTAIDTTLAFSVSSADTTIAVSSTTGFPSSFPYTLALGYDTSTEELVNIVGASSTTLTVGVVVGTASVTGRGADGTTAQTHAAGSSVKHVISGRDLRETQSHYDASSYYSVVNGAVTDSYSLHGIASGEGNVVGTLKTQELTNKTISGSANSISNIGNAALTNSSVTVNGSTIALGSTATVTAAPTAGTVVDASITSGGLSASKITGTAVTQADTGTVTSTMILDGTILNADINTSAGIVDTKLATIATAGKVANSATTATNANTVSTIVARDSSGNFSAGTITASLTGNVTGNVTGSSGSTTGNADTATNVAASGITGTTLASNVAASSLTSFGANPSLNAPAIAGGTITGNLVNSGTIQGGTISVSSAGTIALGTAGVITANSLTIDANEISYLDNISSNIQTQIDGKLATPTSWVTWTPTWGGTSATAGNATVVAAYNKVGKTVNFRISIAYAPTSPTSSFGSTGVSFFLSTIPGAPIANTIGQCISWVNGSGNRYAGEVAIGTDRSVTPLATPATAGGASRLLTTAIPFTWGSNDVLLISGTYEVA